MPIRRFQLQTWTERELVILTSRSSSQLEALATSDPGDQRNLSVAWAAGTDVPRWDYDD